MKKLAAILLSAAAMMGCNKASYKKTAGGMPYQVYKGKGKEPIRAGNFVKVQLTQKIKDSVYFTTEGKLPIFLQVTENPQPYDLGELWTSLRLGDSVVATQMMDTFIRRSPQNIAPQFKKGDRIITYIKVLGVFANDSLARIDDQKSKQEWTDKEIKFIEQYLAGKNITARKTRSGAFVQTIRPGTGNLIDSGKYVSVNYTGETFAGVRFDSNTDTAFHHTEPYPFVVMSGSMIKGFDEAVTLMRQGEVAKVYIPSLLAYGPSPTSPLIKPFENLIFDIEIVIVQDKEPAPQNVQNVQPLPTRQK
jgi:FKBP-type peptidyl-prolyl cis-trans isomerase